MILSSAALFVAIVIALPTETSTCATNGICGGQPYCAQPAAAPASCSCAPSYGCGQYGCYRLRARAAKNFSPYRPRSRNTPLLTAIEEIRSEEGRALARSHGEEPLEELDERAILEGASPTAAHIRRTPSRHVNPNEAFLSCCMDRKLPDACLRKCNFASYTKEALTAMYFKQDPCPFDAMKELQFCAAQGRDHTECCARNGVTTTLAGPKCLTFCDQRPGRITQLDMSYVSCFDRFEGMKACFWHDIAQFFRA